MDEPFITLAEASVIAGQIGVHQPRRSTIWRWTTGRHRGQRLHSVYFGNTCFTKRSWLESFLNNRNPVLSPLRFGTDRELTFSMAARIVSSYHGHPVSKSTIWRWANQSAGKKPLRWYMRNGVAVTRTRWLEEFLNQYQQRDYAPL